MDTTTTKPGWQTTEFWMNLATQASVLWGAVQGFVPPKIAAIVSIAGVAVYTVARTVVKAIADLKATKTVVVTAAPIDASTVVTK